MKVNVKNHTMMYPAPAVVASAYDEEGNADACTLAFATMCSHHPPAVMIAINSTLKRKTLKSIFLMTLTGIKIINCNEITITIATVSFHRKEA